VLLNIVVTDVSRWGQQHRAAYQLLQTEAGGASDRLCQSEGLADLGLVCTSML